MNRLTNDDYAILAELEADARDAADPAPEDEADDWQSERDWREVRDHAARRVAGDDPAPPVPGDDVPY